MNGPLDQAGRVPPAGPNVNGNLGLWTMGWSSREVFNPHGGCPRPKRGSPSHVGDGGVRWVSWVI